LVNTSIRWSILVLVGKSLQTLSQGFRTLSLENWHVPWFDSFPCLKYAVQNPFCHLNIAQGFGYSRKYFLKKISCTKNLVNWINLYNAFSTKGFIMGQEKSWYISLRIRIGRILSEFYWMTGWTLRECMLICSETNTAQPYMQPQRKVTTKFSSFSLPLDLISIPDVDSIATHLLQALRETIEISWCWRIRILRLSKYCGWRFIAGCIVGQRNFHVIPPRYLC